MKKRVLFLDHTINPSGGEKSLLTILNGIKDKYKIFLIAPVENDFTKSAREMGIDVYIFPLDKSILKIKKTELLRKGMRVMYYIIKYSRQLSLWAKQNKISLIYTNSQKAHIYGTLAGIFSHIPVVWHFRDILHGSPRLVMNVFSIVPKKIIAISNAVKKQFLLKNKVIVIYNGVNVQKLHKKKKYTIGYFGQLAAWKAPDLFLEVFRRLKDKYPTATAVVVGDALFGETEFKKSLIDYVKKHNLKNAVEFTGFLKNPYSVMAETEILVHLPREEEPFGRVIIEAMGMGVPVITFKYGSTQEVVGDAGILVEKGDLSRVVDKILELLKHRDIYEDYQKRGLKRQKMFTEEVLIKKIMEFFEEFLCS